MLEKNLEAYFCLKARRCGGTVVKLNASWNVGIPDRLAIMPGGVLLFVELKTQKGRVRPEQDAYHAELAKRGHTTHIVRNKADVDSLLAAFQQRAEPIA